MSEMSTGIVEYITDHGKVKLSPEIIKKYLVSGDASKVTEQEVTMFLQLCYYQGLNPFLHEAYLVKFGDKPASIVVGKEVFTKRAGRNPNFIGCEAGVIVGKGESIEYLPGTFVPPGFTLFGGWAKVFRRDREKPIEHTVSLQEYNKGFATWTQIPATMIRKVALVQALREAFPEDFQGMYSPEEMPVDMTILDKEPVKIGEGATQTAQETPKPSNSDRWKAIAAVAKELGITPEEAKTVIAPIVGSKPVNAWTDQDFAEIETKLLHREQKPQEQETQGGDDQPFRSEEEGQTEKEPRGLF